MSYTKSVYQYSNLDQSNPEKAFKDMVRWTNAEYTKLEDELKTPEVRGIQFEVLYAEPDKYKEGDLYYFDGSVPEVASTGLYIREASSWRKL